MTSSPIPLVLLGKMPPLLQAMIEAAKPDFDIVQTYSDVEEVKAKLADTIKEQNIQAVIMAGGFKPGEFESIYETVAGAKDVAWFRPESQKPGSTAGPPPGGPPPPAFVAGRLRKGLDAHREDLKASKGAGEVWYF